MKRIIILFLAVVLVVPLVALDSDTNSKGFQKGIKKSLEVGAGYINYTGRDGGGWTTFKSLGLDFKLAYQLNSHISAGVGFCWNRYVQEKCIWSCISNLYNLIPVFIDCKILHWFTWICRNAGEKTGAF